MRYIGISSHYIKQMSLEDIIEFISGNKNTTITFKLRRLPGKDFISCFTILGKRDCSFKEYSSAPNKSMVEAVRESAIMLLNDNNTPSNVDH